jgi:hypothetical protein
MSDPGYPNAAQLVAEERTEQVARGFNADHDDRLPALELAKIAAGLISLNSSYLSICRKLEAAQPDDLRKPTYVAMADVIERTIAHGEALYASGDRSHTAKACHLAKKYGGQPMATLVVAASLLDAEINRMIRAQDRAALKAATNGG